MLEISRCRRLVEVKPSLCPRAAPSQVSSESRELSGSFRFGLGDVGGERDVSWSLAGTGCEGCGPESPTLLAAGTGVAILAGAASSSNVSKLEGG